MCAFLLAIPLVYVVAAAIGSLVPRNAGWQEPSEGVEIFVRTNGVHSDLVLPANKAGVDWYTSALPEHVPDPNMVRGWVAIGWGQREFYLETQEWADLTLRLTVRALAGGDALMHVDHVTRPQPSGVHRPLRLAPEAYRRMADGIGRSFERDDEARTIPLIGAGYADNDVFYEAEGTYHAFRTSNQWTADILALAGVTIGVWTPFEQGIMWRFRDGPDGDARE